MTTARSAVVAINYKLAMSAGRDAGDRSMHAHGRTVWALNDWKAASAVVAQLLGKVPA